LKNKISFWQKAIESYKKDLKINPSDKKAQENIDFILNKLKNSTAAKRVTFEILESEAIQDFKKVERFINEVKRYGSQIAIDDFGSGYSNFSHILELNVDYLKIDSSLVKNVLTDENSKVITQTIINFASNLKLKTIAEYVEDIESLELLEKMGVDFIQGYYIGKPKKDIT